MSVEPLSPPARPTWRKSAEERWLAIKLRRDSTGRLLASYHVPEYGQLGEPVPLSLETIASLAPRFQFDGASGILGLNQSLAALGRIFGPAMAGFLFEFSPGTPFTVGGVIILCCVGVAALIRK